MESVWIQLNQMGQTYGAHLGMVLICTTVMALVVLSAERLFRRFLSLRLRYYLVGFVFLQLMVVPCLLLVPLLGGGSGIFHAVQAEPMPSPGLSETLGYPYQTGTHQLNSLAPGVNLTPPAVVPWLTALCLLWGAGLGVMAGWSVRRFQRVVRQLRRARRGNCFLNDILAFSREQMRVRGPVTLKVCRQVTRPWVVGLIVPVIILPHDLGPRWGSRHVRAVLMRQLAYIKHGLAWWRWIVWGVQGVYFFHPLVWWARYRLMRLMEERADETVLTTMGEMMANYPRMLEEIYVREPRPSDKHAFLVAYPCMC